MSEFSSSSSSHNTKTCSHQRLSFSDQLQHTQAYTNNAVLCIQSLCWKKNKQPVIIWMRSQPHLDSPQSLIILSECCKHNQYIYPDTLQLISCLSLLWFRKIMNILRRLTKCSVLKCRYIHRITASLLSGSINSQLFLSFKKKRCFADVVRPCRLMCSKSGAAKYTWLLAQQSCRVKSFGTRREAGFSCTFRQMGLDVTRWVTAEAKNRGISPAAS